MKHKKEIKELMKLGFEKEKECMIPTYEKITKKNLYIDVRYQDHKSIFPSFHKTDWYLIIRHKEIYHASRTFKRFEDLTNMIQKLLRVDESASNTDFINTIVSTFLTKIET